MSPSVDTALYFSLSWTFWEATSVLCDLEGDGAISLVHVLIMGSAIFAAIHAGVCRGRAVPRWGGKGGRGGKKLVRVFSCHGGKARPHCMHPLHPMPRGAHRPPNSSTVFSGRTNAFTRFHSAVTGRAAGARDWEGGCTRVAPRPIPAATLGVGDDLCSRLRVPL